MACVYEYKGKTYDKDDFTKILLNMKPSEASKYMPGVKSVPNAPFKKTWSMLAFKKMVRYASENGFDSIAWTQGAEQVQRYKEALRKAVDRVEWTKTKEGIHLKGYKNDRQVVDTVEKENEVSDAIGKSMGDSIIQDKNQSGYFDGDDITISDTGMAGFYDKILPSEVNKFFNKKAWGKAKVGEVEIKTKEATVPLHMLPITPEMKSKALREGMPLYHKPLTPNKTTSDPNKNKDTLLRKTIDSFKNVISPKDGTITRGLAGINNVYDEKENKWFAEKDHELHLNKVEAINFEVDLLRAVGAKRYNQKAKNMDMAIHIYLDLKRNPSHLDKYYNDLSNEDKKIVDLSRTIDKNPKLKAIADKISESYEELGSKAKQEEIIKDTLENYVGRAWKFSDKASTQVFQKFITNSRHSKQRVFETILEGMATKGMELQVKGSINNLKVVKDEIAKVIEDKKLLKELQKTEHLDTGEKIFTDKTGLDGYTKLDGFNFSVWKPYGNVKGGTSKDTFINDKGKEIKLGKNAKIQKKYAVQNPETERAYKLFETEQEAIAWQKENNKGFVQERTTLWERRQLFAPDEIANRLNKITGRSVLSGKFKIKGVSVVDTLTKYNAHAKALLLMTGLFHHQAFMRSYMFGTRNKTAHEWRPIKAYKEGMVAIKNLDKEVELGVRNGLTLGLMQDWQEDILNTTDTIFGRAMDKFKVSKAVKEKLNHLRERQAKFLFGELGAGLKVKAFMIEYRNAVQEHPEIEENERARMVASLINADFGGLHLGRMGRDPTLQHIFRLVALAPDWTESNIISMVRAIKAGGKVETSLYRKFWASVFAKSLTATLAMNIALSLAAGDDDDEFKDKFKRAWKSGNLKWMDINITPVYKKLGGKEEAEKYFSLIGHFRDPIKFVIKPIVSAHHKGSVLYRLFHEMMVGSDWKGEKFTTFSELIGVDDKGVYLTTRKGKYRAGDPKGGKLKGRTVAYSSGAKGGPVSINQIPSYLISQGKGVMPIQVQNALGWMAGEINWFDAATKGVGLYTSTTYPTPKKIQASFVDEYISLKNGRKPVTLVLKKIKAYNHRRAEAGKPEEKIQWQNVRKKAEKEIKLSRIKTPGK